MRSTFLGGMMLLSLRISPGRVVIPAQSFDVLRPQYKGWISRSESTKPWAVPFACFSKAISGATNPDTGQDPQTAPGPGGLNSALGGPRTWSLGGVLANGTILAEAVT